MIIAENFPTLKAVGKKQPEKIWASMGFEPVTSAIPVRCSTNWAIKPHARGQLVEFISSREEWNDVKYIRNNSYLNCGYIIAIQICFSYILHINVVNIRAWDLSTMIWGTSLTLTYLVDEYWTRFRQITRDVGFKTLRIPWPNIPRLLRFSAEPKHVWLLEQSVGIFKRLA